MTKIKGTNGQTTIYKTLHRKLKLEQHEPIKNQGWKQFQLHMYPSSYELCNKSWIRKGQGSA